jgi:hypothetical protein
MSHPYENQPARAFWSRAVAGRSPFEIVDLWNPRFNISKAGPIVTLGSCFAQHISRALIAEGFCWSNAEPAPLKLSTDAIAKFNYEVFSARTGNIYTVAMLRQWVAAAVNEIPFPDEIWSNGDRIYDPFRPTIEPLGFASSDEMIALRQQTIEALRSAFSSCEVFIFTLGLTEGWINASEGHIYAMCPGTGAGVFSPENHLFKNYNFFEIHADLSAVLNLLRSINPEMKILLTVSPVPLTATASGQHVLSATISAKSILRAVASAIVSEYEFVDYFPSYEIISGFPFGSRFYEPNMRSVSSDGVNFVMKNFFAAVASDQTDSAKSISPSLSPEAFKKAEEPKKAFVDIVCEDMLLDQYAH